MTDTVAHRRSLLKPGVVGAAAIMADAPKALAEAGRVHFKGDAAILRFLAAVEIIESDLWLQYAELGGTQDNELPGLPTGGSPPYIAALQQLDGDMPQYIHDNTEDEFTHEMFINAYLVSRGAEPVNLDRFRTLPRSRASGANQIGRLTNLMQLTVDTTWYTRYRSRDRNPDLDPGFKFANAVPSLAAGQFPRSREPTPTLRPRTTFRRSPTRRRSISALLSKEARASTHRSRRVSAIGRCCVSC